jgi:large subunit ribosomal protein L22
MELTHHTRNIRIAPRKLRLVVEQVKHMPVGKAIGILPLVNKGGATHVLKSLKAAVDVAKEKNYDLDSLVIQRIFCDEGTAMKRMMHHSRGRSAMIMKKYSHLSIVLKGEQAVKAKKAAKTVKTEEPQPVAVEEK